jgi:hypothetical protein
MKRRQSKRKVSFRRCGHCRKKAVWRILWEDGRATWHTCAGHKALGLKTIRKNGRWACIVSVRKVSR